MTDQEERIQKFIANNSSFSRRQAENFIELGSVLVNGTVAKIGQKISPKIDLVTINDQEINADQEEITIAYNKPRGIIVSKRDPQKRKTIYDDMSKEYNHLVHIGRLDKESEGILLLTTNGELCYRLTHPKYRIEKEYLVHISGIPDKEVFPQILNGLQVDDIFIKPTNIQIENITENGDAILRLALTEGRKREIRRLIKYLGFNVKMLQRIRIGNVLLADLENKKIKKLSTEKIDALKQMVGL
ncbi:MAG: pseudouridine synthase [Dehalococcoidia bacterium]